ncbi:MAG: RnfABCDGE type electron transport complex subunit G [Clostridium sp.]|nr:RnfABCDGE type electron transport complex subunit G [Clostridium sp.]
MKKLESSLLNMTVVLTLISVIAGGALAYVNKMTQEPIEAINAKNLQDGIKQVILGNTTGELTVEAPDTLEGGYIVYATDQGTAVSASENGFGGTLTVLVGFDTEGSILGYTILTSAETPGLGAKAATWFQKGAKGDIIGKNPGQKELSVSKDGGEVDAITASTITSRAFLRAINNAYKAYANRTGATDGNSGATQKAGWTEEEAEADNGTQTTDSIN